MIQLDRAWHKTHKKMFEVLAIDYINGLVTAKGEDGNTHTFGFKDTSLLPLSEIHDDHETELGYAELRHGDVIGWVYEEEIIRCKIHYESPGWMLVSNNFPDGYVWIADIFENDGKFMWIPNSRKLGNIYENPKLLEEAQ